MATPKTTRKTTKKPATSRTKKTQTAKKPAKSVKELEHHYKVMYELKVILLVAFTLFTMLSLYTSTVGNLGHFIKSVYLGMGSYVGYVLPIFIFIYVFVHINLNLRPARNRLYIALTLLLIGSLLLTTMMVFPGVERDLFKTDSNFFKMEQYKTSFIRSVALEGGGVLGELMTLGILKLVGNIGAFIVIILCFMTGFIIWTRISIHDLWEQKRQKTIEKKQIKQAEMAQILEAKSSTETAKPEKQKKEALPQQSMAVASDSEHFLSTLDAFKRQKRKKDVSVFDYDTYEAPAEAKTAEVKPASKTEQEPIKETKADVKHEPEKREMVRETVTAAPMVEEVVEVIKSGNISETIKTTVAVPPTVASTVEAVGTTGAAVASSTASAQTHIPEAEPQKVVKLKDKDIEPEIKQTVNDEIRENVNKTIEHYTLPPMTLLSENQSEKQTENQQEYMEMAKLLEETLNNFNVDAKVISVKRGPSITMFEVQLSPGIKVSKVVGLSDDIALNLATSHVRIAPIPGKAAIGIEVPNKVTSMVTIKEVLSSGDFQKHPSKIAIALGKDISGNAIVGDLASMPHLLIAGATGSGKSVCVNTIISSILYRAKPDEVKFLMIDPKVVELSNYNGIPHLILPVVTDPKKASVALNWAVNEMTRRYKLFAEQTVRDMKGYNKKAKQTGMEILPQIVVIIDELADLMMVAPNQVEDAICRLAQMARAAGIHLIVATQRPSVDVITGLIKANIPSRIAFSVSSSVDSRTIIDMGGAEKLLGKGDMLFYPVGAAKPKRTQGAFMSDEEVEAVVTFIKNQSIEVEYNESILDDVQSVEQGFDEADEYLEDAIRFVLESGQASASMMQRRFRVGYNRAARMVDSMEERGIVGPSRGSKPREVLMTLDEFEAMMDEDTDTSYSVAHDIEADLEAENPVTVDETRLDLDSDVDFESEMDMDSNSNSNA